MDTNEFVPLDPAIYETRESAIEDGIMGFLDFSGRGRSINVTGYDIDAIFDATFTYSPGLGYVETATVDEFWAAVKASTRTYEHVARELVTEWAEWDGDTPIASVTLQINSDNLWEVHDGGNARTFELSDAANALRSYAEFVEEGIDDQDDATQAEWLAESAQARSDADAL